MSGRERQDRRGSTASHPGARQATTPLGMAISVGVKHVIDMSVSRDLWGKACDRVWVNAITQFTPTSASLPQTLIRHSLSSYYHHLPCFPRAYSMPRLEISNSVAHKKTAKSEVAVAPGKSGVLSSRAKKEKAEKQNEAKKELDRLFALSTTGEDLNSTLEEGSGECEGQGHAQGQA